MTSRWSGEVCQDDLVNDRDRVLRVVQLNTGSLLGPDWRSRRHEMAGWMNEFYRLLVADGSVAS